MQQTVKAKMQQWFQQCFTTEQNHIFRELQAAGKTQSAHLRFSDKLKKHKHLLCIEMLAFMYF